MVDIPQWWMKGDWFDVCSCNIACPCEFAQPPTNNHCEGVIAYHIREGVYGDVRLDGLSVIGVVRFDATTVDPTTVLFGPTETEAAPVQFALDDVDGDGDTDLILHFNTQATGIQCGETSASLTGETLNGQMIRGSDSVKTAGCK